MAAKNADVDQTVMPADKLAGHLIGILGRVKDGSWTDKHFIAVQEGRDPFALPTSVSVDVRDRVEWWKVHFKKRYRINPDFSNLYVPERQPGFDRLVIIPKGLTHRKWIEMAREIHGVDPYVQDLDGSVPKNVRTPKDRSYGIWIRDRQEADVELRNLSANQIWEQKISGIILLERLVAGTAYLFDEMCHMDVDSITLCTGSRYSGGRVPSVHWNVDARELCIRLYSPAAVSGSLRASVVVS